MHELEREPSLSSHSRCKNQFFFTWNGSANELRRAIESVGSQTPNVHIHAATGVEVHFLGAHVGNKEGSLYTRVYHDSNHQKYALPYVIGHSTVAHSHWLRSALMRAVRYCTSVEDFNRERIYLEVTCLTNGYSLAFVEKQVQQFFTRFDVASLRVIPDPHMYRQLRRRLFNFISEQQRAAEKNEELETNDRIARLSYRYEYGSKHLFDTKLREILSKHLDTPDQPTKNKIKIILATKHRYSMNALLSGQKPSSL